MNNKELQTELSRRLSLSQKEVAGLMKLFVDEYTERFSEGEDELPFLGLGTLEVRQKEQRVVVNPITRKRMLIPPKLVLAFRPSVSLKSKIKNLPEL